MQNEDDKNRLRVLSLQQNIPLKTSFTAPTQPTQLRVSTPYTPPTPAPRQTSFGEKAESFISGAGSNLGGGLLRLGLRAAPTAARFTPVGLSSYASGRLGGRDVFADLQRKGEELAQESERLQAQEIARQPDQAMARRGMQFGSAIKGTAEAALTVLPAAAASRVAQATNIYRTGIRAASPAIRLGTRIAENVISGLPATAVSTLQEVGRGKTPNIAREALIGTLADAVIPVIGKVVNRGRQALMNVDVKNLFTKINEPNQIKEIIKAVDNNLPESLVDDAAEALAKSSELEQVDKVLEDLIGERPIKPVTPEAPTVRPTVTPAASAAITQAVEATAKELAKTTDTTAVNVAVDALFPNLDTATKATFADTIAKANDPEVVKNVLQQAQERSQALSTAIRQVTPEAPTIIQRQAEAAARLAEQPPVVTTPVRPVTEVPTVTPTPSTVQGATAETIATPMGQPRISEVLYGTATPTPAQTSDFLMRYSPQRVVRENITRPIQDYINRLVASAQVSPIAPVRGLGRLGTGVSRELGVTPELLAARKRFLQGTAEFGKLTREDIVKLGQAISESSNQRVWATLDPELAAAKGIKVDVSQLTPEESAYRNELVKVRDALTNENLSRGLITDQQAAANWFKRGYDIFDFDESVKTGYDAIKKDLLKQYKGRKDISQELVDAAIDDPAYLLAKKSADSHAAWGMVDYGNWLANNGFVSDVPLPGYRQLRSTKLYGNASGKYVPTNIAEDFTGFQYNIGIVNKFNDLITAYDNLKIRKAKKAILTVLNPAVRLGNEVSNRVIFAQLGGVNPVTFNKNFMRVKSLRASRDPLYLEAVKRGLTGLDITQKDFTNKIAEYMGQPNMAQRAWEWTKNSYSGADDNARIAAFITNVERGYSLDEAARLAQRAFQDYKSVGFFYDMVAKTPIVGNAFARFSGDAARILTNTLTDRPLTLAGSLAGIWSLGEIMSRASNETAEEKKVRETRFGAPVIPFTNISLEIQTPWGAVNTARFLPFYNLNEIQGNLTKFLPIAGNPLKPNNWQDPLLGQVLQLATDKDFRGLSIKEPENKGQFRTPTPSDVALENRVRFALTQNLPLGREVDAIYSAIKGQEDVYGGERNIKQAIGRAFGLKVEQFGPEQVAKVKANEAFFADKKYIEDQLATMPKDLQEKYKKLTGYYKLRDQVENTFQKGAMRFKKEPVFAFSEDKYKELSTAPELYDLLREQKVRDFQRDGRPIPPEFDTRLSNEFRKQLIENKALRPGDDLEADERMFNNPEWDTYQAIKKEYTTKAKAFFPQTTGEFNDELVKHQNAEFPEKTGAYKAYTDAYALYTQGQGPKPTFTDAVAADKDKYNNAKLSWVNNERKARGLAPISPEVWNNVTFGFTTDEEKVYNELRYGKGLGGFGFKSTSPEYKAALAAIQGLGITVKPLSIVSAAPRNVKLKRVKVPTTRRTARIRLR